MMVVLFHAVMKEGGRIGMGAPLFKCKENNSMMCNYFRQIMPCMVI
jgi:hypothetical protein